MSKNEFKILKIIFKISTNVVKMDLRAGSGLYKLALKYGIWEHNYPDNFGFFEPSFPRMEVLDALPGVHSLTSDEPNRNGRRRINRLELITTYESRTKVKKTKKH